MEDSLKERYNKNYRPLDEKCWRTSPKDCIIGAYIIDNDQQEPMRQIVQCPFNPNHFMKASRLPTHINKCELQHPNHNKVRCFFNTLEFVDKDKLEDHLLICPHKDTFDEMLPKPVQRDLSPSKFNRVIRMQDEWDNEHWEDVSNNIASDNDSDDNNMEIISTPFKVNIFESEVMIHEEHNAKASVHDNRAESSVPSCSKSYKNPETIEKDKNKKNFQKLLFSILEKSAADDEGKEERINQTAYDNQTTSKVVSKYVDDGWGDDEWDDGPAPGVDCDRTSISGNKNSIVLPNQIFKSKYKIPANDQMEDSASKSNQSTQKSWTKYGYDKNEECEETELQMQYGKSNDVKKQNCMISVHDEDKNNVVGQPKYKHFNLACKLIASRKINRAQNVSAEIEHEAMGRGHSIFSANSSNLISTQFNDLKDTSKVYNESSLESNTYTPRGVNNSPCSPKTAGRGQYLRNLSERLNCSQNNTPHVNNDQISSSCVELDNYMPKGVNANTSYPKTAGRGQYFRNLYERENCSQNNTPHVLNSHNSNNACSPSVELNHLVPKGVNSISSPRTFGRGQLLRELKL